MDEVNYKLFRAILLKAYLKNYVKSGGFHLSLHSPGLPGRPPMMIPSSGLIFVFFFPWLTQQEITMLQLTLAIREKTVIKDPK